MNAIEIILDDHRRVKSLFRDFEQAQDPIEKQQIAEEAILELRVHSQVEEQVFYPAVRERGDERDRSLVSESEEEHHRADALMEEIKGKSPSDADYDALFTRLVQEIEHHIIEEETQMLPEARRILAGELDRIADRMKQLKSQLAEAA